MAVERHIAAPATGAKVVAPPAKTGGVTPRRRPASAAESPSKSASSAAASSGTVTQIRAELAAARRDLALQKLDSPATIRQLRKKLARALTVERAKTKEAA